MELTQRIKERLREVEDWNAVVDQLEADASAVSDKSAQSVAFFDLARACEDVFLDKARAMQCYQRAFKLDQSNLVALRHARLIYQQMGHLEMVSRLMGLELKANQDAELAAALNYAYGTAQLNLREMEKARAFLQAATSADPNNSIYQARFQETLYDPAQWQQALDSVYTQLKAITGEDDPLAAKVRGKGEQFSVLYLRAARILQQESPEDPRLLPLLFKALDADPRNTEAAFLAETLLAEGGQLQVIQKLQDRRASAITSPDERIEMLRDFAAVWQVRLNNPEMAAYFYHQALELAYGADVPAEHRNGAPTWHAAAFRALVQQVDATGQADALIPLARRALEAIQSPDDRVLFGLLAGQLAWRKFDDIDTAKLLFGYAVEQAPEHPALAKFREQFGDVQPISAPSRGPEPAAGELDTTDEDAGTREMPAAEPEAAVPSADAPEADEPEPESESESEDAYEEPEEEEEESEEDEAADADAEPESDPEPESLGNEDFTAEEMALIRKAREAEKRGGKRAIDAWRDAMQKLPEKQFPRTRLKELYIQNNKWSNVADLIKDDIKRLPEEQLDDKEARYWELVELYRERLRQPGLVVTSLQALEKLLETAGENGRLLKVVEAQQEQFEAMKRWPDLIGRIRRRAELTEDPDGQKELYLQAGTLFLEKFNNQAEAIKSFEAVLEVDEYERTAIGHLKELYGRRRDWEKMLGVQQKELALIEDANERKERLIEVARTAGAKIKRPPISIELWTQVLDLDPENIEALENLEHMQEREKDWPALATTLERLVETTADDTKRGQYLVKLGLLYSDKISDNEAAIRTWETLHDIDPTNRRAQDALKKLYLAEKRMDALESFYAKQDKWPEFIRVLERESDGASDEQRVSLLVKIAELYRDKVGKPDRAVRALERALGDDPHNLTVAERLLELYEEAGDERHVAGPLKIKLEHEDDPAKRQSLLRRLADLAERLGNDPEAAFEYYRRAFDEDHTGADLLAYLDRLATTTNNYGAYARSLSGAVTKYGGDVDGLPLRLKLAALHETQMQDLESALRTNQAILDIDPEHPEALASLERLFLALGREEDLLEVLSTKLTLASDEAEKRATQSRIGSIHEQLGHADQAIEAYEAVLASGGEDAVVLAALDRIYTKLGRQSELAGVLARELAVTSDDDLDARTRFLLRLGALKQDTLDAPTEAIELFRQVLDLDPAHVEAQSRLERWLEDADHNVAVSEILLPIYDATGAHDAQVRCLQLQADAAPDAPTRVALLLRVGQLLVQAIGDAGRAFDAYASAFGSEPENEDAQAELERIAGSTDRWADLAELYEQAVAKDLPSELQRRLLTKLAQLYDTRLGESEKAIVCYQRAVDIDPGDSASLDALEALYSRDESWTQLLGVYRNKVDLETDPGVREALRFKIAKLQEDLLGDRDEAITTYSEILADDEVNLPAIRALDRLYQAGERWAELSENLVRQLSLTADPETQVSLNLRLADLRRHKLEQVGLAVETYSTVLDFDPTHPQAIEALESLLDDPDHQLAVAKILEEIYKANSDWPKLIAAYDIRVKHSLDPGEKIELLHQIGQLQELAGGEPSDVFAAYGRAFRENPSNQDTQVRLERLAAEMGSYQALVELYGSVAEDVVDDVLRTQLLFKVASIYDEALGDPAQAAGTYEKILSIDPASFDAVDALIEVHRQNNDFEALVNAVKRKAEMVESTDDQKSLLKYAATIREGVMEDPQGAIALFQQVLTVDDADAESLEALVRLYLQLEQWEQLKDVYQRQSELAADPDERRQALYVLGQVYDAELGDVDRAIDTYQAVLELDPADYQAIASLDRLYGQAERWLDQLQILERAVDAVSDPAERTSFRFRIGGLWATKLSDTLRAIEAYRDVLLHDPGHPPTIDALEQIVRGDVEPVQAAEVLAPYYEQAGLWSQLIEVYEVMVGHTDDPVAKIERLHQIAGIYELQLAEFDQAFEAYARALAADAQSETTIEQLERLADVTGEWARFAELLGGQADRLLDPLVKTPILLRLARIFEERLVDVDGAVARYREVLDVDPENGVAVGSLDRIFNALERWPDLVENLRRQISMTPDEHEVITLYFRMGQIHQDHTGDAQRAIEAYREVLNIDPAHGPTQSALETLFAGGQAQTEIAEILEPIYHAAQRWDALVKLGEAKLGATEDQIDRLAIIQNLAEICEHRLDDVNEAYLWWLRAYMDDPTSEQVSEELERLAAQTDQWAHIVGVGEQILEEEQSPHIKLAVLSRSARVLDEKLHDAGRAIEVYRQVLEIEPEHGASLVALDRIYTQLGMAEDLAEILQRRIKITVDGDQLVDLEVRLADVFESQLGSPDQAIAAFNRALENDPAHRSALSRLEGLYVAQDRWQELFDVYQRMVDISAADDETADCYQRMAKLASDALERENDAVDLWGRVLDLRGEDPLALGELALLHERTGRWEDLAEILERRVFAGGEESIADRVHAYQMMGRVYAKHLDRDQKALEAWLNALELDPTNLETLEALYGIYENSQAWIELTDVIERLISSGAGALPQDRLLDLHATLGRVQGEYLMQPDQAISAWSRVLDLAPGHMEALAALEELYSQEARWHDAISVLERKARLLSGEERVDVLMQIAGVWEERLEDREQAAGAYQEILELAPDHEAAGQALEQIYRDTDEWAALAELLITRADIVEDVHAKVEVLQSAAKVFEENLGDADMAFATLQAAFNVDYANDHTARELERLATQHDKWNELLTEYNGVVQQIEDPLEQCELWVKIGRWYGEHLNHEDYGIRSLERALELNPESVSALRELAAFRRRAGEFEQLTSTLARVVPLEHDPAAQVSTLLDLAGVQETELGDLAGAIESHRRVLEIDSDSLDALDALIRLHEQRQDWTALVEVLERRCEATESPEEQIQLRKHVGYVQEANLTDNPAAIETYKEILAQEPTDLDALQALERLYLNANQIDDYLEILESELDATADVAEQVGIYDKMANALVSLADDRDRAAEVLEKVIMLDPERDLTYRQLEELYTGLERWTELLETYRSHIEATQETGDKVELLSAMGEVYEKEVQDNDRAIEAYREILELDPDNFGAATTLSRLQEALEDWPKAVETMARLAELHPDPTARLELLTRMGRVLHEKLGDSEEAELRLNQALSLSPGHVPAMILLAEIYKSRADWLKASRMLEDASNQSINQLEKTRLAAEAAFINFEELEDQDRAVELFARTLQYDPEHVAAGRVLVDIYYEAENYGAADPILDMLTRKIDQLDLDDEEQRQLFLRAAQVARALGNVDKAIKQYKQAYDIDSTNHEVLVGMGDLLFEKEDWDRAFKLYQTILVQHRDTQADEDTVRVYHRLGTIKNRQGEPRKALNYFEKALEVDPHHEETLASVIQLRAEANDWEGVIEAKRALVAITPDGDHQFVLWNDIGALYAEQLGNRDKAADAYQSALDIRPEDFPTLHTLLEIYTTSKRWDDAIHIIDRIVEIETDPQRRSRYNYTAAVLLRDELNSEDAIERFNKVLDDDVTMLKAFQAIDTMLTKGKDWKTLERSYRKMLKRMPPEGHEALKVTLWNNLAEIYRSRLMDFKAAVAAYEVAAKLDPGNIDRHVMMAELYERLMEVEPEENLGSAVREHQILIANEPFRYESYHALFNIYANADQVDKAYCVASVLSFLKKAEPAEERYIEQHKRPGFVQARQRLSEDTLRRHVFHPDEDLYLTGILGLIAPAVADWRAQDITQTFNPAEKVDITLDTSLFSRTALYVTNVINVTPPEVYIRVDSPGEIMMYNARREGRVIPTVAALGNLVRQTNEPHLTFGLAKHLMDLYLPHYCFVSLGRSTHNLKEVLMACLRAVGMPVPGNTMELDHIAREITGRMQPAALDQLRSLIQRFVDSGGAADVKRWANAAELTTYRVGLLLCGDLRVAGQMISQERSQAGGQVNTRDKIKELVLYGISEDYFTARRAVGINVA